MKQPLLILVWLSFLCSFVHNAAFAENYTDAKDILVSEKATSESFHSSYDAESDAFCTLEFNLTSTDPSCDSGGFIDIGVLKGKAPYIIEWYEEIATIQSLSAASTSNPNSVIPDLEAGTYFVKVTTADGCAKTKKITLENKGGAISITSKVIHAGCGVLGGVDINVFNSSPPYWIYVSGPISGSAQTNSNSIHIPDLKPGSYEISIEKDNCVETIWIKIEDKGNNLDYALEVTDATCGQKGSSWVTIKSGKAPYKVQLWGAGVDVTQTINRSSFQISDIAAGNYTLKITDANGCEKNETFNVGGGGHVDYDLEFTNATCGKKGSSWVTIKSGRAPYKVRVWGANNIDKSSTINGRSFQVVDLPAGDYSIKIIDTYGCEKVKIIKIGGGGHVDYDLEFTNATCGKKGSSWVTIKSGRAPYKVRVWGANNIDKSSTINGRNFQVVDLPAGDYSIRIVDADGCEKVKIIKIGGGGHVDYDLEFTDATCGQKGSSWVTIKSGKAPYKVRVWGANNIDKSSTINGRSFRVVDLSAGDYSIRIVDADGCEKVKIIKIGGGGHVDYDLEFTNATCGKKGSSWVTIKSGKAPYKIHVYGDHGVNINSTINRSSFQISDLWAGHYKIKITDHHGCEKVKDIKIGDGGGHVDYNMEITDATCDQKGGSWVTVTSGKAPYKVQISGDHHINITATVNKNDFQISDLPAGNYSIKITDHHGCEKVKTFTINGGGAIDYTVTPEDAKCGEYGSARVIISKGTPKYSVDVFGPNNYSKWFSTSDKYFTIDDLRAGNYTVEITDADGCKKVKYFSIKSIDKDLKLALESTAAECEKHGSIWVDCSSGQAPYTVSWSGPSSGSQTTNSGSVNISGLSAGTYTVSCTDYHGCSTSKTITVKDEGNLVYKVTTYDAVCGGYGYASVHISHGHPKYDIEISGPYNYSNWHTTSNSQFDIQGLRAGEYTIIISDSKGCKKTTKFIISDKGSTVKLDLEVTKASCGKSGSIWVTTSGGQAPYRVSWSGPSSGSQTTNSGDVNITGLTTGSYTVTSTDYNGCSTSKTVSVGRSSGDIGLIVDPKHGSCNIYAAIGIKASRGQAPYTITWSGPTSGSASSNDGNYTIQDLSAGTYVVKVADYNGCSKSETVKVNYSDNSIYVGIETTPAKCDRTGGAWLTFSGGTYPYRINLVGPINGAATINGSQYNISSLLAGEYTLKVTDKHGCATTEYFTVKGSSNGLYADIKVEDGTCGSVGYIDVNISGGRPNYTVSWTGPSSGSVVTGAGGYVISNLYAGTYSVTIKDYEGCTYSQSVTVKTGKNDLSIDADAYHVQCDQSGSISVDISGGQPGYHLSWSGPSSGSAQTNNGKYNILNLTEGTYLLRVTDYNGCSTSKSIYVGAKDDDIKVNLQAYAGECGAKGSIGVVITGGRPNYTVSWTGPSSGSAGAGSSGYTISNLTAGTYTIKVVDYNGCSTSKSVTVGSGGSNLAIGVHAESGTCGAKGLIGVTISGGRPNYTVSWTGPTTGSAGATSAGYTIPHLTAGTYTITVTDANGCSTSKTVTLRTGSSDLAIELQTNGGTCNAEGSIGVVIIGGQPNYTVSWTGPTTGSAGATSAGYTIPHLTAGTYTITVTDANGCSTSKSATINTTTSNLSIELQAQGGVCSSRGLIGVSIIGGRPNYTVSWTGPSTGSAGATSAGYSIPDLVAGTYTVTVTDANGCSTSKNITISDTKGSLGITLHPIAGKCGGQGSISVTIEGGQPNYTISWSGAASGSLTTNSSATVTDLVTGTYTVTVTDRNGCSTSRTTTVRANSTAVDIDLKASAGTCSTGGYIDVTISGMTPWYTVHWVGPVTNSVSVTGDSYRIESLPPGFYNITVTDDNACSIYKSITVGGNNMSNLSANVAAQNGTCGTNGSVAVTVSGGTPDYTISWAGPSNNSISISNTTYTIDNLVAGNYQITITDKNGCSVTRNASVNSSNADLPKADFYEQVKGRTVEFLSTSSLGTSIWDFGDNNSSTMTNPVHTYDKAGTYTVCLTVTNDCGSDKACRQVVIEDDATGGTTGGGTTGGGTTGGGTTGGGTTGGGVTGGGTTAGEMVIARVIIADMSGKTGDVLQLPVMSENCGKLATFSGVLKIEDSAILEIKGLSPSAISPQYNKDNRTFSYYSTGLGTDILEETVLFYVNVELIGKDGDVGEVSIDNGRADLEMTCTSEGFDGPVRPEVVKGKVSIVNQSTTQLTGEVHTFWGEGIEEAMISIKGEEYEAAEMTSELGTYELAEVPLNHRYEIAPSKEDDPLNGLSTYGLFVAQKYLLGYETKEIESPYQVIAMDANCDNRFTTFDLFIMQQLVIGNIDEFPGCPSWVFVKEDFEFAEDFDATNVFPYESAYSMMIDEDKSKANFIGIKVGDILGRARASASAFVAADSRSSESIPLAFEDAPLAAGEEIELSFTNAQLDEMVSYQLGIQLDPNVLELVAFIPVENADFANAIAGVKDNQAKISWYDIDGAGVQASATQSLFKLKVRAKQTIESLADYIQLNNRFGATAHDASEESYNFEIVTQSKTNEVGQFEVYQNQPNPFKANTNIVFEMAKAGDMTLIITDQFGRAVRNINGTYAKGTHQIVVNRENLAAGLYYYTLSADDQSITKRMLIID